MGCLAGPVVVCAVGIKKDFHDKAHKNLRNLRESKLLSATQREKFTEQLVREHGLVYALASCSPKIIDKVNIYQAARLAMRRAIQKLLANSKFKTLNSKQTQNSPPEADQPLAEKPKIQNKTIVLVDGKTNIKGLNMEQMAVVKGDRKVFAIACASIIAKGHRDKMMTRYAKKYPGYGFEKHKGYGTLHHKAQLVLMGPCEIHRKSFAPVAKLL